MILISWSQDTPRYSLLFPTPQNGREEVIQLAIPPEEEETSLSIVAHRVNGPSSDGPSCPLTRRAAEEASISSPQPPMTDVLVVLFLIFIFMHPTKPKDKKPWKK